MIVPRIRSIKPEFFQDEDIARLPIIDRLVFVGLWTQADKAGRLEDRPARLKVQIIPYEKADIEPSLDRLVAGNFLVRYVVNGRKYLAVRTFTKHQRPHHTEQESEFPAPTPLDNGATTVVERMEEGREGKGKEEEGEWCPRGGDLPLLAMAWNSAAAAAGLPTVSTCSTARLRHIASRLKEADVETWTTAYRLIAADPFCRGQNDRGWRADFDYALRPEKSGRWLDLAKSGSRPMSASEARQAQILALMPKKAAL